MAQEDYLAHHGILGQKWGVRRYQNYDGSLTAKGRERRGLGEKSIGSSVKEYASKKRAESQKRKAENAKALEKAKQAERKRVTEQKAKKAVEDEEALKERLRRHPRDIYKYRDELSKDDIDEIIAQVQWDRKCKDIRRDEYMRGLRTIEDVRKTMKLGSEMLNDGLSIYNSTALIYNGMLDHQVSAGSMSRAEADGKKWQQMKWKDSNQKGGKGSKNKTQDTSDDDEED